MRNYEATATGQRGPSGQSPRARKAVVAFVLGLAGCTVAGAGELGTVAHLEVLLDARTTQATCHELPPTPSPDGPTEPLEQCTSTRDGVQFHAIRTLAGRIVWLDYTGPWQRGPAGPAQWKAMLETLERAFGKSKGPREQCRLWSLDDGVIRAVLLGSTDADDGVVRLLRIAVSGADTQDALAC